MIAYFLNLKLRVKLLLAFASILLLSALLMLKAFQTIRQSDHYKTISETIDGVVLNLLEMDVAINYFMAEGYKQPDFQVNRSSEQLQKFQTEWTDLSKRYNFLNGQAEIGRDSLLQHAQSQLNRLNQQVQLLAGYLKERGFKDYGLEGDLRKAIHAVETSPFPYEKADMLTLRRHEKDFFLRKDLKYRDEFNKKLDDFERKIGQAPSSFERDEIMGQLNSYRAQFNGVVKLEEKIGLQSNGLRYDIQFTLNKLRDHAARLRANVKEEDAYFHQRAWTLLGALFLIQLSVGLVLSVFYANQITQTIKELQHAIAAFASGSLPQKLSVRSHEEIGKTKLAFNQLIDRIKAAQDFSSILGEGKLDTVYEEQFKDDLLAKSLIQMQHKLSVAKEEQRIANWRNLGAAQLNEVLKSEGMAIDVLGNQIITMVVKYLNANQGALYLVQKHQVGQPYAQRIATYAYHKRKFIDQEIEAGQGLIGQCLLEKSTIVMKVVPDHYVRITSGLGEATPRAIVIVPMKIRNELFGIIELASFEEFESYQIEFLEKIGENIASILSEKKTAAETRKLLDEAKEQAEQLASQEEEIRQNAEEMQAITEQLEREKKQLLSEINLYKSMAQPLTKSA